MALAKTKKYVCPDKGKTWTCSQPRIHLNNVGITQHQDQFSQMFSILIWALVVVVLIDVYYPKEDA